VLDVVDPDRHEAGARQLVGHAEHAAAVVRQAVPVNHDRVATGGGRLPGHHEGDRDLRGLLREHVRAGRVALEVLARRIEEARRDERAAGDHADRVVRDAARVVAAGPLDAGLVRVRLAQPRVEARRAEPSEHGARVRRRVRAEQEARLGQRAEAIAEGGELLGAP